MALIANMLGLPPPSALAPLNSPRPVILAPPTDSIDSSPAPHPTTASSRATSVSTASLPSSPSTTHTIASQTLKTNPTASDTTAQSEDIELNSIGGNSTLSTGSTHPLRSLSPSIVHYTSKDEQISLVLPSCLAISPVKLIPPLADNAVTTPQEMRESLLLTYCSSSAEPSLETKEDNQVMVGPVETLPSSGLVLNEEETTTGNREEKNEENYCLGSPERKLRGVREYEDTVERLLSQTDQQPSIESSQLSESDTIQTDETKTSLACDSQSEGTSASLGGKDSDIVDPSASNSDAVSSDLHTSIEESNVTEMQEEDRTVGVSSDAGLNTSEIVARDHGHTTGDNDIQ